MPAYEEFLFIPPEEEFVDGDELSEPKFKRELVSGTADDTDGVEVDVKKPFEKYVCSA